MHPNLHALRRYLLGDLPSHDAEAIESHMEGCKTCEETIHSARLEQTVDSFVERLRSGSEPLPFDAEPELQAMLAKVQRFFEPSIDGASGVLSGAGPPEAIVAGSIGEYDLEAVLGSGGMGTVYRAVHRRLRRRVAIKLLRADRMGDRAALDRFEREMEAVGRLEHPHIVKALDAGEANGTLYLAMEYVDGASIAALAGTAGTLSTANACEIVRQAAIGLAAAHRSGLVHRDVKPGNLMLARTTARADDESPDATVKVLDLGLARIQGDALPGNAELTSAGQVMGTVDYMAPEQAESSRDVGPAADVYALGATLYRLLAGVSPLGLDPSAGLIQKLAALVSGEPLPLETRRPDLPRPLCDLVRRTLARDPGARPSASEFAKALRPFAVGADLATLLEPATTEKILDAALTDATVSLRPAGSGPASASGFAASPAIPSPAIASPAKGFVNGGRNRAYVASGLAAGFLFVAIACGVMIYRVATDRGTLVVEIADPATEAKLVAEGLKIVDTESGRDYVIQVAPAGEAASTSQTSGEYDVQAPAGATLRIVGSDGLEVETSQFKLLRGETVRIKVYAEQNVANAGDPSKAPTGPAAPDPLPAVDDGAGWLALAKKRRDAKDFDGTIEAATKALAAGVEDRSDALRTRAFAYATRRILAESLADLDLLVSRDAKDADALRLRSLVRRELGDAGKAADDAAAAAAIDPGAADRLKELPPASLSPNQELLAWLAAHGGGYGDGVRTFETGFESVTFDPPAFDLVSMGEGVDDETVELLRRVTRIEKLFLPWETSVSDAGFARLCTAPSLAGLSELGVNAPRVTVEGWKNVRSLKRLRKLGVSFQPCPPIADALVELKELEALDIGDASRWNADDIALLRGLSPTLREFSANLLRDSAATLHAIEGRPLTKLALPHCPLDDEDVAKLEAFQDLESLDLSGTLVSDASAETLARFPRLERLQIGSERITVRTLEALAEAPSLRSLHLSGAAKVTREGVAAFREAKPLCEVVANFDAFEPESGVPAGESEESRSEVDR